MTSSLAASKACLKESNSTQKRRTMNHTSFALLYYAVFAAVCSPWHTTLAQDEDAASSQSLGTIEILLRFYDVTRGLSWDDRTNWLVSDDVCTYYGIECYDDSDERLEGQIRKIDLSDNHLVGNVPRELFDLPFLQELVLRKNADLIIPFDNLGSASYLEILTISDTATKDITGVAAAGASLKEFHFTGLGLDGPFHSDLLKLTKLQGLYANYNKMTGNIPAGISQLTDLKELFLFDNNFSGEIPTEIGSCTNLEVLALTQNAFSGELPHNALNMLTNLNTMSIGRESGSEKGLGLEGRVPSLSKLSFLTNLFLENQMFTEQLHDNFLEAAPKDKNVNVHLENNHISGTIPDSMLSFSRLNIYLEDNKITSTSDDFCDAIKNTEWMEGEVKEFGCDALLCPANTYAKEYGRRTTAGGECLPCTGNADDLLGASSCAADESVPKDERTILSQLYYDMGGRYWKNNDNWLSTSSDITICDWYGLKCNNEMKVVEINLRNNDVTGTTPVEIWSLEELRTLLLASNTLDKVIFEGSGAATKLTFLDLAQSSITSVVGISELTSVEVINLSSNNFSDNSLVEVFQLMNLKELYLSNSGAEGKLDPAIGNLINLERLEAYGNKFTGQIPTEIGTMTALKELRLGENNFGGILPTQLGLLTDLETLSIHQTTSVFGIGGPLLPLVSLTKLTKLHLDSNKLTSTLPSNLLKDTVRGDETIEVFLSDNMFQGTIPSAWGDRFEQLKLDLTGNQIDGLDDTFCAEVTDWMDGSVRYFNCDAILCAPGTFNEYGRRTDEDRICRDCPGANQAQFYGSYECDTAVVNDEVSILKELYYSTGGSNWNVSTGWLTSQDHCNEWYGLECNSQGQIVRIDLSENMVSGIPPQSIFTLPKLEELQLQSNAIVFSFVGIEQATQLEILYLSDTGLTSIAGIGKAKSLVTLHLTNNALTGTIPDELFELTKLKECFLNYNRISGRIPSGIIGLKNIEELYLLNNRLEGQIPASIGALTNLKVLALSDNLFSGTLPVELNDLTSIEVLAIQKERSFTDDNGETKEPGPGIKGPMLSFNKLPKLKQLYLGLNSLTGTIPFDFLDGVEDKSLPINVDLVSNDLEGNVPAALVQFDEMTISLAGNKFTGIANGLCLKELWMKGEVARYGCNAIMCPPNKANKYGRQTNGENGIAAGVECTPCPEESSSLYYGSLNCGPDSDTRQERAILEELYKAMDGDYWVVKDNWLDEDTSICDWFGISCVSNDEESVRSIHLSQNGMVGTLPTSVYQLPNLEELNIANNGVKVSFDDIELAENLLYLDLDKTSLSSLSGIENTKKVGYLHIVGNKFAGSFPSEIFKVTTLEILDMSNNDFSGGDSDGLLPFGLKNIPELVSFSCNYCGFKGPIPSWIEDFTDLQYLSMSSNSFTGDLPVQMKSMTNLQILDLSEQTTRGGDGITGELLDFANLDQLREIYLEHNSLNGQIPATFLQGTAESDDKIIADLRWNKLTGSIPPELKEVENLYISLSDNKIDTIPNDICNSTLNGGKLTEGNDCGFILCEKGFYSELGRSTTGKPCIPCQDVNDAGILYYGSTLCGVNLEKLILSAIFVGTNGPDWTKNDNWGVAQDICTWYGITCHENGDKEGKVKSITLGDNNMKGDLTNSIYDLEFMEHLELRGNNVTVPFDNIGRSEFLQTLFLSETLMTSIAGIGQAKALTTLHLTSNNIDGPLPGELFNVQTLEQVYLNYNKISGAIPSKIGMLANVKELYIFHNRLTGNIPTEVGLLQNLEILSFGENDLTGTIPTEMLSLSKMEVLSLQREKGGAVTGSVEESPGAGLTGNLPSFENMPKLRELFLGDNSFVGDIPDSFISGIDDKSATIQLDLTMNELSGSIPTSLAAFNDLRLYLAGNRIEEIPDVICAKEAWFGGEITNGCDALLCPPGSYNTYGRRVNDDRICQTCSFTDSAKFFGSITCDAGDVGGVSEREILRQFYAETGGSQWKNRNNWDEDNANICTWHGVQCASENGGGNDTVTKLELPSNQLKGTVPPIIFQLPSLELLNLHDNRIDFTFQGIEAASNLEELYLHSTDITSMRGVGKASNLRTLHLENNAFAGEIPNELYDLSELQYLYLSDSGLTGMLSEKIGNLENLIELYCHKNAISGEIPSNIEKLSALKVLVLSENNLYGTLPDALNSLTSLKELYIDSFTRNNGGISGPLLSFSGLTELRELHLGDNSLTGSLPEDFLKGAITDDSITIELKSNQLTGTVPGSFVRFDRLDIDLTGNKIVKIHEDLCLEWNWMDGLVDEFGCDAILCPVGDFNSNGRQSTKGDPCVTCNGNASSPYLGNTVCPDVQIEQEKQILEKFYDATGGSKWKESDGWMNDNVDICRWFGVACSNDGNTVESILLGSNNLVGTPPKELFELKDLKFLWLYSNPISFDFNGIEKATSLTSLLLDSTGLTSLKGIGAATALVDVDVRFNALKGPIPTEVKDLPELQSFLCGNNRFTGTIPTFKTNRRLTTLRMGDNLFTGDVPDFSVQTDMNALDLSGNRLSGPIPSDLLKSANTGSNVFIDLSSNSITGTVPAELARFDSLTMYLRDNMIEGINPTICSKAEYNDGDAGEFGCDGILCPSGSYAPGLGRASSEGNCLICDEEKYYGSSTCGSQDASAAPQLPVHGTKVSVAILFLSVLVNAFF